MIIFRMSELLETQGDTLNAKNLFEMVPKKLENVEEPLAQAV